MISGKLNKELPPSIKKSRNVLTVTLQIRKKISDFYDVERTINDCLKL